MTATKVVEKSPACKSCRYAVKDIQVAVSVGTPNQEIVWLYECRYNAPLWNSGVGTGRESKLWPTVRASDWCGKWTPEDGIYWEEVEDEKEKV